MKINANDQHYYKIADKPEKYITSKYYIKDFKVLNKMDSNLETKTNLDATKDLMNDNYLTKRPYKYFKRDESPFETNVKLKKDIVKNNILHTPIFKMITKFDGDKKYTNYYDFQFSENKLEKQAKYNLEANIQNNQTIKDLKKKIMNNPENEFTGCSIKFEFPNQDLEVATIDDLDYLDWKPKDETEEINNNIEEDFDENNNNVVVGSKNKTFEENYLNIQKFDELNKLISEIKTKKYKETKKLSVYNKSKILDVKNEKKNESSAFSNKLDVYHQIFEVGEINDSIDWDSLLSPDINVKLKEAKMKDRHKKFITELINKEVEHRDYNYERLQDAWFQQSCLDKIKNLKYSAKSELLGIKPAKNDEDFKKQMQRNFTKEQRSQMGIKV
eukprot:Mrub_04671.p1 GENE.Mrub_04671~~Mrub_04671.p1  ORF type:complete len:396 (+),score=103.70 Mrub_04671:30-1190(+)